MLYEYKETCSNNTSVKCRIVWC